MLQSELDTQGHLGKTGQTKKNLTNKECEAQTRQKASQSLELEPEASYCRISSSFCFTLPKIIINRWEIKMVFRLKYL